MESEKNKKDNLIKKTCKELGLTYKQLGEKIGYSESALNKMPIRVNKVRSANANLSK